MQNGVIGRRAVRSPQSGGSWTVAHISPTDRMAGFGAVGNATPSGAGNRSKSDSCTAFSTFNRTLARVDAGKSRVRRVLSIVVALVRAGCPSPLAPTPRLRTAVGRDGSLLSR